MSKRNRRRKLRARKKQKAAEMGLRGQGTSVGAAAPLQSPGEEATDEAEQKEAPSFLSKVLGRGK
jgi:hypothetical protein